jgi:hypothetical protein
MHHHQRLPSGAHSTVSLHSGDTADLWHRAPSAGALAVVSVWLDEQHRGVPGAGLCRCAWLLGAGHPYPILQPQHLDQTLRFSQTGGFACHLCTEEHKLRQARLLLMCRTCDFATQEQCVQRQNIIFVHAAYHCCFASIPCGSATAVTVVSLAPCYTLLVLHA